MAELIIPRGTESTQPQSRSVAPHQGFVSTPVTPDEPLWQTVLGSLFVAFVFLLSWIVL
jgi:hypothetical protein